MSDRPLGGGGDRSWLTPLTPDGDRPTDDPEGGHITGTHTGHYFGLNGRNMRPGYHYEWLNAKPNEVMLARHRGFELVRAGDDDSPVVAAGLRELQDESDTPTPLDTSHTFQDVVYARIPEDKLRAIKDADRRKSEEMLRGGADAYVAGATPEELDTVPPGESSRFVVRGGGPRTASGVAIGSHSLVFRDTEGKTDEVWTPRKGIVERG